jgi:hypothetical protein
MKLFKMLPAGMIAGSITRKGMQAVPVLTNNCRGIED